MSFPLLMRIAYHVSQYVCTITVNGVAIDYVDSFRTSSAPDQDAGLWLE